MASSSLDQDTRKILSRWTKQQFYVYIRPMTARFVEGVGAKHKVYWVVAVEFRTTPPGQWRGEGYDLDEVIRKLDERVPKTRKQHHEAHVGWLASEKAIKPKVKAAPVSERPRRKKDIAQVIEMFPEKTKKKKRKKI